MQAVMLDVTGEGSPDGSLGLAERFQEQFPHIAVLLVTDRPNELGLSALRAGVRDLVEPGLPIDEIRWVLLRAIEANSAATADGQKATPEASGRVITVASPKGGVGKTTLATNLAVGLAQESPNGTVLVDLDIQFGDVAAALDLDPEYTLADAVHGAGLRDVTGLKTLLTKHRTGLHVLCGVKSPVEGDEITAEHVNTILGLLISEFRYVVIDTAPGMGPHTLAALDHTTDLVLTASLDVPSVRGLRKEMELLDELELPPATRHVAVNMVDRGGGLSLADVEATIGRKVDFAIPRSSKVMASTNRGRPILEDRGRDKVSKDLEQLVSRFRPTTVRKSGLSWSSRHRGAAS
ncbi:AAA family ATPase [Ornithinimicrobium murale]|uniref:AAA family ATPase n=1 Tax=Ornithinimicrobium murale TaxID=1050153 RepID=UPI001EE0C095|nr:AAA family ATPase [Ornithinimicrobium murale]